QNVIRIYILLLLLLVVELLSQGCCQHWSYDMSPGGKRQSGSCDGAYPMMGGIWSLFGCDVSPHWKHLGATTAQPQSGRPHKLTERA
uniref:Gonadoliberin n=1 Tax=Salmo trutta TaxID=8032 RepID=A0A673YHQ4_SALTR